MRSLPAYPISPALPRLCETLRTHPSAVLTAPPGSGKTTLAPLALLDEPWLRGKQIILLEPRRMAARAAAWRMAELCGTEPGGLIGYHVRLEKKASAQTRILVLTEGLLTRRLLSDPELSDAGLIIFDEFHERSLQADLSLALALDVQRSLRGDLRLLIMSATLDAAPLARHLSPDSPAPVLTAEGRMFPVECSYHAFDRTASIAARTASGIRRALSEHEGSVLAFLPGEGEIRSCCELLSSGVSRLSDHSIQVFPLYSALPRARQDAALRPAPAGTRKVVLATSIAESSLTIEGISCVVDCGYVRASRFSPGTGMSHLETLRITRDRADQRAGRAGRLGPGFCYRLWTEQEHRTLSPAALPEILSADLAPLVLSCADWGATKREALPWVTQPPVQSWDRAVSLLQNLHALDSARCLTAQGRALSRLGAHPRLAHAMLEARRYGDEALEESCLLAAALSEGVGGVGRFSTNAELLVDALRSGNSAIAGVLPSATRARIRELAQSFRNTLRAENAAGNPQHGNASTGILLSFAYPDRIARRRTAAREAGRFVTAAGRAAFLDSSDPLAMSDWLVIADIDDGEAEGKIRLAAPLTCADVEKLFAPDFTAKEILAWNPRKQRVDAVTRICLGAIAIREKPLPAPDAEAILDALCGGIRECGSDALPWTKAARELQARVEFLRRVLPEENLPAFSDAALLDEITLWLGPYLYGMNTLAQVQQIDLFQALESRLNATEREKLRTLAPTQLTTDSGAHVRISYEGETPTASLRIQQAFGMRATPRLARGKVPLLLQLLSPAMRPVQITSDLESFWKNGYPEIRKELRGRYPKHNWPLMD